MLIATGYPQLWHSLVYLDKWVRGCIRTLLTSIFKKRVRFFWILMY